MKIGIDVNSLSYSLTGVGRYVYELTNELTLLLPNAEFYLYSRRPIPSENLPEKCILRVEKSKFWNFFGKNALWLKFRCGALANKDKLDIFWAPCFVLPGRLNKNIKTILTVHDLVIELYPRTVKLSQVINNKLLFKGDLMKCDALMVNSRGTSDRIYHFHNRRADLIIRPGVSSAFHKIEPQEIRSILAKLSISKPYFLSIATLEPRKNLEQLIDAFIELKNIGLFKDHSLVLVGSIGWKNKQLLKKINQHKSSGVIVLGYVNDLFLPALYCGSALFIYPSIYEGYGMPVAEAVACQSHVLASDIPEIREAGGSVVAYIKPTKDSIVAALKQIQNHGMHGFFPQQNSENALRVTWRGEAKKFSQFIEGLY